MTGETTPVTTAEPSSTSAPAASPATAGSKLYPSPAATPPAAETTTSTTEPVTPPADPAAVTTGAETTEQPKDPAKPVEPPPLFTLPEDFKPPESARALFETAIKTAMKDGKLDLTPQAVADLYVSMARDANTQWETQIKQIDTDNLAACQKRFTPKQLAAAESAVGWFGSYEPGFAEFAKAQLNNPVFVSAMRLIGEALQEDDLLPPSPGDGPPAAAPKSKAERMGYAKKT